MSDPRLLLVTVLVVLGTILDLGAFLWMLLYTLRRRRLEWVLIVFACPPIGLAQTSEAMDGNRVPIRLFLAGWVLATGGVALMDF